MKIFQLLLVFNLLISWSCYAGDQSLFSRKDFVFTVEFYPSFTEKCRITLLKKEESISLSLDKIYGNEEIGSLRKQGLVKEKSSDLLCYNYTDPKYWGTNVFLRQIENVPVALPDFRQFKDSLINTELAQPKNRNGMLINDGVKIYYKYKSDSIIKKFWIHSPTPADTSAFNITKALFKMFESSFKSEIANNYIEQLKGYFNFGLCVKHIADNPLEYRFYSHLSINDAREFYALIRSLPNDQPIILDLSNFGGMGTMFYPDFKDLIQRNQNVYWIVNERSVHQVFEIGVKPDHFFTEKQQILKKIHNTL